MPKMKILSAINGEKVEYQVEDYFEASENPLYLGGLIFSFLGFVIAAPGAVYIEGVFGQGRVGKTALAGPMTNLVLGTIFLAAPYKLFAALWAFKYGVTSLDKSDSAGRAIFFVSHLNHCLLKRDSGYLFHEYLN